MLRIELVTDLACRILRQGVGHHSAAALAGGGTYQQGGNSLKSTAAGATDTPLLRVRVGLAVLSKQRVTRRCIQAIEIRLFIWRQAGMGDPSGAE